MRKITIKWKTLLVILLKGIHTNTYWNNFAYTYSGTFSILVPNKPLLANRGCWVGLSVSGVVRGEFPLSSASSSRFRFSFIKPTSKLLKGEKERRVEGFYAWSEGFIHAQDRILSVELDINQIGQLIPACVHVLCTYTWDHFNPHLHSSFLVGSN